MRRTLALTLLCLVLLGCPIYSSKHPKRPSRREICAQALKIGWCYDDCKRKPDYCCEPKEVKCGPSGMCVWKGCDGSLVFGVLGR